MAVDPQAVAQSMPFARALGIEVTAAVPDEVRGGLDWTPERIQEYCRRLVSQPLERARDLGFLVEEDEWRASHLFGLRMPPALDVKRLQAALQNRKVFVSLRGSALRVSPNVYNDEADLAALVEVLNDAAPSS